MRIVSLSAENILRLSAVEIRPDGSPVVVIAGENESGKSSVLAAIEMAIGGKDAIPAEPIRRGESKARVVVDLGDIIVTRTFTPGGTQLVVTNRDGLKYPSPQALLDGLVSKLTFDPLAFAESDDKTQEATLRRLAGINTTDIETQHKATFDERTLLNRELTRLKGAVDKAPHHPAVGLELTSAQDVAKALADADVLADAATAATARTAAAKLRYDRSVDDAGKATQRVESLWAELGAAELASVEADEAVHVAREAHETALRQAADSAAKVPDRGALRLRMAEVEVVNGKVRDNLARAALVQGLADTKAASDALTAKLAALDAEKAQRLASASFPVDGLGLSDTGVTWNGLPFSQASTAIRVRASVAIGMALNPKLKVLRVANGNDLGQKNLKLLADAAEAAGVQIWVERIAGGDGLQTIVIEDGAVREVVAQ